MKLLIILSVIACSHAAKLDRTYLPPASAASAGGSSDSLRTPVSSSGAAGNFGSSRPTGPFAPSGSQGSFTPSGSSGSFAPSESQGSFTPSGSFAPSGSQGSFAPSGSSGSFATSGYSRPDASSGSSGSQFGQSNTGAFGKTFGAPNQPSAPSSQYGQPSGSSFNAGFAQPAQNFGSQAQNFGNQAQNFDSQAQNYQRNPQQASADRNAEILRFDNQNDGETFSYNFETSNGIAAEESGVATNGVQAQGAFSYSDDDGQVFRVAYTADENGYQPQGEHLPTPHPIPDAILRSIELNARAAAAGTQEGAYNLEEDNSPSSPQTYNYNTQMSYNQSPAGQSNAFNQGSSSASGAFNQAQGKAPSPTYGALNAVSSSKIQGSQGPSQQYGAPTTGFSSQSQGQYGASSVPSSRPQGFQGSIQQYNAPNAGSPSKLQGQSQQYRAPDASLSRPNNFQGPSQQYGAPDVGPSAVYGSPSNSAVRPNSFNGNQGATGIAPSSSASRPSGFNSAQAISEQYQTRSNQYSGPQGPTSSGQVQDKSGYQYDKPQGSLGATNGPSNQAQYRPQNGGSQGPLGGFSKYNGAKASESLRPTSQSSQNYEAAAGPNAIGSKGNFGSRGQTSFGSPAKSNAQTFGQPQGQSFNQGFRQPGQSQMSDSGYQYNQPQGSQNFGNRGPQTGFKAAPSQGQTFGAPRQPPSFTEAEGYKY